MTDTLYARVGGEATFGSLVERFYAAVESDPVLRPLYPHDDLGPAAAHLTAFLVQYWGGPRTYSDTRGHPRLRMRHAPFHIGPAAREAWLRHMLAALDSLDLAPADDRELRAYLTSAALSLQNQPADQRH